MGLVLYCAQSTIGRALVSSSQGGGRRSSKMPARTADLQPFGYAYLFMASSNERTGDNFSLPLALFYGACKL
eukprot:scaffold4990_cov176-Amphora_coffeaeformis.AAC.11